jgi:hypothetical protein
LALSDNASLGGIFATTFPLLEIVSSRIEEQFYNAKEKKWEDFIEDAKNFLDNYHELLGILKTIRTGEVGEVNGVLKDLNDKVYGFANEYDKDGNGSVDIFELIEEENRKKLAQDLDNNESLERGGENQLGNIILAIQKLEEVIINYRQGSPEKEVNDNKQTNIKIQIENYENSSQQGSFRDENSSAPLLNNQESGEENNILNIFPDSDYELEEFSSQEQLETQIEILPKE